MRISLLKSKNNKIFFSALCSVGMWNMISWMDPIGLAFSAHYLRRKHKKQKTHVHRLSFVACGLSQLLEITKYFHFDIQIPGPHLQHNISSRHCYTPVCATNCHRITNPCQRFPSRRRRNQVFTAVQVCDESLIFFPQKTQCNYPSHSLGFRCPACTCAVPGWVVSSVPTHSFRCTQISLHASVSFLPLLERQRPSRIADTTYKILELLILFFIP